MEQNSDVKDSVAIPEGYTSCVQNLQKKIEHAKKRIQDEQHRRDANVEEYLKMAAVAQRSQLPQVKVLFEKRNTKAATNIAALQRKVDRYQRDLQILVESSKLMAGQGQGQSPSKSGNKISSGSPKPKSGTGHQGSEASQNSNTSSHRTSDKNRSQNSGHGIDSVLSKPITLASLLLKAKSGSADNIPQKVKDSEIHGHRGSENIAAGENSHFQLNQSTGPTEEKVGSECSLSANSSSVGADIKDNLLNIVADPADLIALSQHFRCLREEISNFREELENYKTQTNSDSAFICQGLQEERFRSERLEEQVNDLTELHQAETCNLKQALADAEEKLSYQSEERLRDLAEILDACQAKISRLEQQQQQLVTIEGLENSTARALAVKLVNIGLTMLQLILLLLSTVVSTIAPFVGSRIRLFVSIMIAVVLFLVHRKWPSAHEETLEFFSDLFNRWLM